MGIFPVAIIQFMTLFLPVIYATRNTQNMSLRIPSVEQVPERHNCIAFALPKTKGKIFATGFETKISTLGLLHHMVVLGCANVGRPYGEVWECGTMKNDPDGSKWKGGIIAYVNQGGLCESESRVLFVWTRGVEDLVLPEDVAFELGPGTDVGHLLLQLHYRDSGAAVDTNADNSVEIVMHYTETPPAKLGGVNVLATFGTIPAKSTEQLEIACEMDEDSDIHVFRFRVHTHDLGSIVSGYHVQRGGGASGDQWSLIGERDPNDPQVFYPTTKEFIIRKGDFIAARCTMINDGDKTIEVGQTTRHEMCNYYVMYWSAKGQLKKTNCYSPGPPQYYWKSAPEKFTNMPAPKQDAELRAPGASDHHH